MVLNFASKVKRLLAHLLRLCWENLTDLVDAVCTEFCQTELQDLQAFSRTVAPHTINERNYRRLQGNER